MLYNKDLQNAMLDVLENRMSGIACCIEALVAEGYIPNKNKYTILNWSAILIAAYENVDVLSKEQQTKLDNLYNKVINL